MATKTLIRNRFQTKRLQTTTPYKEGEEPLVKQSMKAECDINNILAKFQKTGSLTHAKDYGGQYGEVESVTFHDAMNIVKDTQNMFDALPSTLRNKFNHSPGQFLDFVQNPENLPEMHEMGLTSSSYQPVADLPLVADKEPSDKEPVGNGDTV